jgi:signal transduction histidine kinase
VLGWLLQLGLFVPLAMRRRAPFAAFAVIAAVGLVQWMSGVLLPPGDLAMLVALYTVAAHASVRKMLAATLILETGVALATDRWAQGGSMLRMFILLSGMTTAAAVIGLNVRTRRAYLASLEDRAARLELERDQQAQIAAASERALIAREVHDIVTHSLSVMVALADGASFAMHTSPDQAAEAIGKASEVGRQAITEMQRVLGVLRSSGPDYHPQPGLDQIDTLLSEVRSAGLPVELVVTGAAPAMSSGVQLAVYRVIQEALTNTRKHAAFGTSSRVSLKYRRDVIDVEIVDDGQPPAQRGSVVGGHGIAGMRERVAVYGGTLDAGPLLGGGWRVHASLSLRLKEAEA